MRTPWLHELRWPEVAAYLASERDTVLIPIGATEQHGVHLPLAIDTGWAVGASEYAARHCGCLIAPPLHFGWSPHHMGYPGTLTLSADTLKQVCLDLGNSLVVHGFRHLIFVNGNRIANLPPLEIAAVQLQNRTGAQVAVADTGLIARTQIVALCESGGEGLDHAAEAESSFGLFWAGEHVDMSALSAGAPTPTPRPDFDYPIELDPARHGNAVSRFVTPKAHREATAPSGHVGEARTATRSKGRQMIECIGGNLARFVTDFEKEPVTAVTAEVPT